MGKLEIELIKSKTKKESIILLLRNEKLTMLMIKSSGYWYKFEPLRRCLYLLLKSGSNDNERIFSGK